MGTREQRRGRPRRFLVDHRHEAAECRSAYAAWNGFESRLRSNTALSSCASGSHRIVWTVEAADEHQALTLLPPFIAQRTVITEMEEVSIP